MSISLRTFGFALLLTLLGGQSLRAQTWLPAADMPGRRYDMAAVELAGQIYVLGGLNNADKVVESVLRYAPDADEWTEVAPMDGPRHDLAAVVLQGRIYAIGGADDKGKASDDVHAYDPATDSWSELESMENERRGHQAVVLDGKIYVAGGVDDHNDLIEEVEVYDPATDEWSRSDEWSLETPRVSFALVSVAGEAYVLGGLGGAAYLPLNSAERFGPINGTLTFDPAPLFAQRGYLAAAVIGESVFLMGGVGFLDRALSNVVRFTPSASGAEQWTAVEDMMRPRARFAAVAVEGRLYAIGGQDGNRVLSSVETLLVGTQIQHSPELPDDALTLEPNKPNPFSGATSIEITVRTSDPVRVRVFDAMGRHVRTLVEGTLNPGRHALEWDGATADGVTAGSGVFFVVAEQMGRQFSRTMIRIR